MNKNKSQRIVVGLVAAAILIASGIGYVALDTGWCKIGFEMAMRGPEDFRLWRELDGCAGSANNW